MDVRATTPSEPDAELRFGFGKNWADFIAANLSEERIEESRRHLAGFLRLESLEGLTFLDIGCGSGLHSLAAYKMGADRVLSFDFDADSVATTRKIHAHAGSPANWTVMQGSVLDRAFMEALPKFDVVYSWGVLHHTGNMWEAVRNAALPMTPAALFYIALYSSDNYVDPPPEYWLALKRSYNQAGRLRKRLMELRYVLRFQIVPELKAGRNPLEVIRRYGVRGMTYWTDVRDWLGGYPMDFAGLQETQRFCKEELGLDLVNVMTGEGCTEYLFCRPDDNAHWRGIVEARTLLPLPGPFVKQGGVSYTAELPSLEAQADSSDAPRRSPLMLYEDGTMLGLAHSLHDHVARLGQGRFSHWGPQLYFSASDNSDPNTNGRRYSYCERF